MIDPGHVGAAGVVSPVAWSAAAWVVRLRVDGRRGVVLLAAGCSCIIGTLVVAPCF